MKSVICAERVLQREVVAEQATSDTIMRRSRIALTHQWSTQMQTFLRDSIWQFIGVVLSTLLGLMALRQRSKKEMVYELVHRGRLMDVYMPKWLRERVKILVDDIEVNNLSSLEIRISNQWC